MNFALGSFILANKSLEDLPFDLKLSIWYFLAFCFDQYQIGTRFAVTNH